MIGFLATPLAFCSVIQIVGLWLIRKEQRKVGLILCDGGLGLLLVLSMPVVGERLMGTLEGHSEETQRLLPGELDRDVSFVVVLSGGFHSTPDFSPASRLGPDSLRRLIDGMALCSRLRDARLILSGGVMTSEEKPAEVMAELALSIGWDSARLSLETEGKTTRAQAERIKEMIGEEPFYLVTSANHIPKAMHHFEAVGCKPIAYPSDHIVQKPSVGLSSFVPSIYGLALSNAALHEFVGRVAGWLMGV